MNRKTLIDEQESFKINEENNNEIQYHKPNENDRVDKRFTKPINSEFSEITEPTIQTKKIKLTNAKTVSSDQQLVTKFFSKVEKK